MHALTGNNFVALHFSASSFFVEMFSVDSCVLIRLVSGVNVFSKPGMICMKKKLF